MGETVAGYRASGGESNAELPQGFHSQGYFQSFRDNYLIFMVGGDGLEPPTLSV